MKSIKLVAFCIISLFFIFITSACSSEDASGEEGTNHEAETRMYEHELGETRIPVEPKRVVSDWYYGDMIALGVRPVGLTSYVLNNHPYIEPDGTEDIGSATEPNIEKIISLNPDLIIIYGDNQKVYDQYSKIAPTIALDIYPDPKESVKTFGEILGKQEEAEDWITSFEEKIEAGKEKIADAVGPDETFTIFNVWDKHLRVYGDINMGGYILYHALGLKPQENVQKDIIEHATENAGTQISLESMPDYAGEHVLLTVYKGEELAEEIKQGALWQNLEAVKDKQVYEVDFDLLYNEDPVAMEEQLDVLVDLIVSGNQ
jgi:iron complex transport system substrate-binding protein